MNAVMAERTRLIIDTDETVKRAVLLRKIKMPSDPTISDVVNGILREVLAAEIAEVERYQSEGLPPAPKRSRKGRGEGGDQ
jgi:hypothetical protein